MAIHHYPQTYKYYTYDWSDMTSYKYAYQCNYAGQIGIGMLMYQLGLKENLDMDYGIESSGALMEHSIRALENMGYSCGGVHNNYNSNTVVSELKQGYGVFIGGFSEKDVTKILGIKIKTSYHKGHQWLAHGLLERRREFKYYQNGKYLYSAIYSEYYPLCNWGWDGNRDGYYLSEAFDTNPVPEYPGDMVSSRADQDYNYQYKITTITGIRK